MHVHIENWKNFRMVDMDLGVRTFLVGPNASGKSNLLDVFRFISDIVRPGGGGLQRAVDDRGGLPKIRCLSARFISDIVIEFSFGNGSSGSTAWKYRLALKREQAGQHRCVISQENVWMGDKLILERPDKADSNDSLRLTQTHLEQINSNESFRAIYDFFLSFQYLHIVPQIVKNPDIFSNVHVSIDKDSFGLRFLEQVARTNEKTRGARLRKISKALAIAVPQLKKLSDTVDNVGVPHLEVLYEHWRPNAGKQQERQLSDGTLRLIGILWTILDTKSFLMLEEPELSLHPGIVSRLAPLMYRINRGKKEPSQIMISTHSPDLLSDNGIGSGEVFLLSPDPEGTTVRAASDISEIVELLNAGLSPADAIIPYTEPKNVQQLNLFE